MVCFNADYNIFERLKTNIRNAGKRKQQRGLKALKECTEDLLKRSQELVPVDTGTLKASGKIQRYGNQYARWYRVSYSATVRERLAKMGRSAENVKDPDFNYAFAIHEDVPRVFMHPNGGQAKFLEQPYRENKDKYIRHIASAMR